MSKTAGIERTRHDKLAKQILRDTKDPKTWNELALMDRDYFRALAQREIESKQTLHFDRHINRAAVV